MPDNKELWPGVGLEVGEEEEEEEEETPAVTLSLKEKKMR